LGRSQRGRRPSKGMKAVRCKKGKVANAVCAPHRESFNERNFLVRKSQGNSGPKARHKRLKLKVDKNVRKADIPDHLQLQNVGRERTCRNGLESTHQNAARTSLARGSQRESNLWGGERCTNKGHRSQQHSHETGERTIHITAIKAPSRRAQQRERRHGRAKEGLSISPKEEGVNRWNRGWGEDTPEKSRNLGKEDNREGGTIV